MNRYESTSGMGSGAGSTFSRTAEQVIEDTARTAAQQVEKAADAVSRHGREAAEGVRDVAGNFADAFEESLRNRPVATVGMAAAAGFIIGALWKS